MRPILTHVSVDVEAPEYAMSLGSRRWHEIGPRSMAFDLRFVSSGECTYHDKGVPDLRSIAEKLTISELFQVINRKLDKAA